MKIDDILSSPRKHPLISAIIIPILANTVFIVITGIINIKAIIIGHIAGFILIYFYYRFLLPLFYKTIRVKP